MRVVDVFQPAADKHRQPQVTLGLQERRPRQTDGLDDELLVDRGQALGQDLGHSLAGGVADVVTDLYPEAGLPDLSVPGQLHLLFTLGQIEGVVLSLEVVAKHTGDDDAVGLHGLALECICDIRVPVEAVGEPLPHMDIAEEVRRDSVAIQLTATDQGIGDRFFRRGGGNRHDHGRPLDDDRLYHGRLRGARSQDHAQGHNHPQSDHKAFVRVHPLLQDFAISPITRAG